MSGDEIEAGGFLQSWTNNNGYLSPAASTASSSVTSSILPRPRSQPLRPGSSKESTFINYMDREVMGITRRYATKSDGSDWKRNEAPLSPSTPTGSAQTLRGNGYTSFKQVARDIDRLVNVLWVSGSPTLQIPYLLSLASLVTTCVPSFPPAPRSMFRLLGKLDYAFASLVTGRDIETGQQLPGFGFGDRRSLTSTEKVRIKSLAERTRVVVVEAMSREGEFQEQEEDDDEYGGETTDAEDTGDKIDVDDLGGDWGMEMARVYDRTLVEIGNTLKEGDFTDVIMNDTPVS